MTLHIEYDTAKARVMHSTHSEWFVRLGLIDRIHVCRSKSVVRLSEY